MGVETRKLKPRKKKRGKTGSTIERRPRGTLKDASGRSRDGKRPIQALPGRPVQKYRGRYKKMKWGKTEKGRLQREIEKLKPCRESGR